MGFKRTWGVLLAPVFFFCSFAFADLGGQETVRSVSIIGSSEGSYLGPKFQSYEKCKKLGNSPALCREVTDQGIKFGEPSLALSDEQIQTEVSAADAVLSNDSISIYKDCRVRDNSPTACLHHAKMGGLVWRSSEPEALVAANSVADCVRQMAAERGDRLGLEVSDKLMHMQNLNNPNSFAFRAVHEYYVLCTGR